MLRLKGELHACCYHGARVLWVRGQCDAEVLCLESKSRSSHIFCGGPFASQEGGRGGDGSSAEGPPHAGTARTETASVLCSSLDDLSRADRLR